MRFAYLLTLALSTVSFADDPFSCVDPDVADAFLGNTYQGKSQYSTLIPEGFISLNAPASLTLVGSRISNSTTTVVYKTSMDSATALNAAVGAMIAYGWSENSEQHRGMSRGFQISSRPMATALCHDDEIGMLSVIANDNSGQTFVSYAHYAGSQGCASETAVPQRHDTLGMMDQIPTLRLPAGAKASNTGMGGGGDEVNTRVDITGEIGRSELQNYFDDQLRNQNWEFQTNWSSRLSSGSVWMLETANDGILIGTLHVFDSGANPMRVRFSVNPADPAKGTDRGSWAGSSN